MIRHCIKCGKQYDDEITPLCPHCLQENRLERLTEKDIHKLHQSAHYHITEETQRFNSGMVHLVLGSILLILGIVFLILSFKYNVQRERVFRPASVEFVMSTICLTVSLYCLIMAGIRIIKGLMNRKFFSRVILETDINVIRAKKDGLNKHEQDKQLEQNNE